MDVEQVLAEQAGVISRRQVLACGGDDALIERRLRRRDWARALGGVYVDHTGPLSWAQRAWAAVLYFHPAWLSGESALVAEGLRPPTLHEPVQVAVDHSRRLVAVPGIRVQRVREVERFVHPVRRPPRLRLEHAVVLTAAAAPDDAAAVARLADACQSRRTTPARLAQAVAEHARLRRRAFLLAVLVDVATGVHSALEHRFVTGVERAHGLPKADRQVRAAGPRDRTGSRAAYRDVSYLGGRVLVELDGRLGHEWTEDRWDDLDRDIASAVDGSTTVRAGWRQVLSACRLAASLTRLLWACGWEGEPTPCGDGCQLAHWLAAA